MIMFTSYFLVMCIEIDRQSYTVDCLAGYRALAEKQEQRGF